MIFHEQVQKHLYIGFHPVFFVVVFFLIWGGGVSVPSPQEVHNFFPKLSS